MRERGTGVAMASGGTLRTRVRERLTGRGHNEDIRPCSATITFRLERPWRIHDSGLTAIRPSSSAHPNGRLMARIALPSICAYQANARPSLSRRRQGRGFRALVRSPVSLAVYLLHKPRSQTTTVRIPCVAVHRRFGTNPCDIRVKVAGANVRCKHLPGRRFPN